VPRRGARPRRPLFRSIDHLGEQEQDLCRKVRTRPGRPPASVAIRRDNTMLIMKDSHILRNQL
jgi:hypothetical protein